MIHGGNMTYDAKVMVGLDWETVDNIVINELKKAHQSLKGDLDRIAEGTGYAISIFDKDEFTDMAMIMEHICALELILKYYGVNVNENQ